MRSYGITKGRFWNGPTGRDIRAAGSDAQLVALYLFTNPHANAVGLYYLPFELLEKQLALPRYRIERALLALDRLRFAHFDAATEVVWVREMAHHQLGGKLPVGDGRLKAASRIYCEVPPNPYLSEFFDRYHDELKLPDRRVGTIPQASPPGTEGPPQGPPYTVPDPVPDLDSPSTPDLSNSSSVLLGRSGNPFAPSRPPADVLFRRLVAAYPPQRVTQGYLTESAFVDVLNKDGRPVEIVFADLMSHLENQLRGYEWRVKRMIPKLEKWLREGACWQLHDEHPPTAIVSERTLQTDLAGDAFVKGNGRAY